MTPPRIAPGTPRELGLVNTLITRVLGLAAGTAPPNLFTTLGRHRSLFRRWLVFASGLMPLGKLSRRDTELVILRVAHRASCAYERDHHVRLAKRAGLSDTEIEATTQPVEGFAWAPRARALLVATDQLHDVRRIDDAAWDALCVHLDEVELIELCMLVGHYEMLAMTLESIGVARDVSRRASER